MLSGCKEPPGKGQLLIVIKLKHISAPGHGTILSAEETALRVFPRRPRNSIKTVALSRFMEACRCCHADRSGSVAALPWKMQGFWTVSFKTLHRSKAYEP